MKANDSIFEYAGNYEKDRARVLNVIQAIRQLIDKGECFRALIILRSFIFLNIVQAEALGVLDDIVQTIHEYKKKCMREGT